MKTSKTTYRRRVQILSRLEDLSYQRHRIDRRINPGHSSMYVPGPADEADRIMRDERGAREERREVDAEMMALAKEAVELGGQGEWVKKINAAAGRALVYWASDSHVGFAE